MLIRETVMAGVVLMLAGSAIAQTGPACNPVTGLAQPLPTCADVMCDRPASELNVEIVRGGTIVPKCRTDPAWGRPEYDDGPPLRFDDLPGVTRYACLYEPPGTSSASPRPLVVFFHGGGAGTADDVFNHTSLRTKAISYDLSGDPKRPGFILISVQGRNLRYPTSAPRDGHHHDFYYRDLRSPSTNPDIAFADRLIDHMVASKLADPHRIYLMGWSNGAFFSQMYGIARHRRATPGGNHVAAVAVFSGADPFANIRQGETPSCQLDPYPLSDLPIMIVSRACDIVACNEAQVRGWNLVAPANPGQVVAPWMDDLRVKVHDTNTRWLIVTGFGTVTNTCTPSLFCSLSIAVINHLRWPDGVADHSGIDHEPAMLDFLAAHPWRPPNPRQVSGRCRPGEAHVISGQRTISRRPARKPGVRTGMGSLSGRGM